MHFNWDIKRRVVFIAVVPGAAIAIGLAFYFLLLRYEDVETALISRGAALARQLAPAAEYGAFAGNFSELQRLAQATVREADVAAVAVHDPAGVVLAVAGDARFRGNPATLSDGWSGRSADGGRLFFHAKIVRGGIAFDDPFLGSAPQPLQLGSVTLELSRRNVVARKEEILTVTVLFTAALLAAALMLAYRLGRDVTEPVLALEAVVGKIHRGELDARVEPHQAGTLRMLEDGINDMAAALEAAMRRSEAALADSEAELREQHEFAQTLLQAQSDAGVGTLLIEDGRIVYANETAGRIYGYSESELRALPSFLELVHPSARGQEWRDYQQRLAGEDMLSRYALPIVTRAGEERIVELSVATLPGSRAGRLLSVVVDITERKRDESLLASAYDELKEKKEEAERANLAKTRFLAAASHDLRQPLHALTLFAAQMENLVGTPPQRRLAHQISSAADAMGELLEALLDLSRLDLAGQAVQQDSVPLDPILQRVVAGHMESARAAGLRLVYRPTAAWVSTDAQLLERMLGNLIGNAVRYTPQGGVLVAVRRAGADVRIEVRDSGIGIAAEHLPFVFQEFYQVANEERDAGKGLGLGLAIVDRLAQALGHRLQVRSRPGAGSTFSITLPRAQPAATQPAGGEPGWSDAFTARVAVISDNAPVRESLCALLRSWGCAVDEVGDEAAIGEMLAGRLPDVLVCDDCCYEAAVKHLGKIGGPLPPLILLGEAPPGLEAAAALIHGRLGKPLRPARLRALLRHLLEEKGAGEAAPEGVTA